MALQLGALRDALLAAGAPPEKADKAAEEVAAYENPLAEIRGTLRVHSWMLTTVIALQLGVFWMLWKLVTHV
ncbi:MAG TPA: hypothetical protein VKG91_14080 [Roseiarcus sp.]|nr:hypothetical protein [Roseiarcus sp.]